MNLKSLMVGLSLTSTLVVSTFGEAVLAQRTTVPPRIPLFSHKCEGLSRISQEISSNRQLFTAIADFVSYQGAIWPQAQKLLTCRLNGRPRLPKETLRLQFGTSDDYSRKTKVTVRIYRDGVLSEQDEFRQGEEKTKLLDVSKTLNVAIEVSCDSSSDCPALYVFAAEIIPGTLSRVLTPKFLNSGLK